MARRYKKSGNFEADIMKALYEYKDAVHDGVKDAVDKSTAQIQKDIKANAPVGTGKYKKGWTAKVVTNNSTVYEKLVYNKGAEASLSHLLENGHALRNGGRARAFPHIAPAKDKGAKTFEQLLEKELKG